MKVYEKTRTRTWEVRLNDKSFTVERFENFDTNFSSWEVFDFKGRKVQSSETENEILKHLKLKLDE
jgi:hypothetical protein